MNKKITQYLSVIPADEAQHFKEDYLTSPDFKRIIDFVCTLNKSDLDRVITLIDRKLAGEI